jgi:translation initiation factor 2B subunit (eIF-2B alpha/beta/delta family)
LADRTLKSIINDRTSGAGEIESRIYVYLMSALRIYRDKSSGEFNEAITRIKQRFNSMANIVKLLEKVEKSAGKSDFESIRENLAAYKKNIEENRQLTVETAADRICRFDVIFTLSNSSVISRSISGAKALGWEGRVNLVESRPRNEGAILASDLTRMGIPVTMSVDANIPDLVKNSKAVFLGADAVTPTCIVNKTGSAIVLEFAAKYRKPVFVVADIGKIISDRIYKFNPDENPAKEIISSKSRNLTIQNNYFEKIIPHGRIQYIIGDEIINTPEVKNLLKHRA